MDTEFQGGLGYIVNYFLKKNPKRESGKMVAFPQDPSLILSTHREVHSYL